MGLFSGRCDPTETNVEVPSPVAGTISNFVLQTYGGGQSGIVINLRVNGANTAITCTTGVGGNCTDFTDTATIAVGDNVTVQAVTNTGKLGAWTAALQ
jgi:hypothetical protein